MSIPSPTTTPQPPAKGATHSSSKTLVLLAVTLLVLGIAFAALKDLPARLGFIAAVDESTEPLSDTAGHGNDSHGGPGHLDDGHSDDDAIAISRQARDNLGLRIRRVTLGTFTEYIEVPGMVTVWPGRTHVIVTSPLTGVINAIHVARGELIEPESPLFALRLTHQDLVKTQEQYLTELGQLDVEEKEIARLSKVASSGAVAGKTLIARQYERDKLLAGVRAARQSMLLHGLTEAQIESIETKRELVREITVSAPHVHEDVRFGQRVSHAGL